MNKEAFRKELEDCWFESAKWSPELPEEAYRIAMHGYITTRLAALDDGDDDDFHFEKNYSYSDMMRLAMAMAGWCSEIRLRDAIHGTDAHNYASKFIKDKFPRSALFETELAKFPETDFNKKDSVDDGQEGKGLEGTLNENKPMEEGHQTVKCYTSEELEKSFLRSACEGYQDAKFNGKKHENVYALINPIQSKEWFKWLEEKNVIK